MVVRYEGLPVLLTDNVSYRVLIAKWKNIYIPYLITNLPKFSQTTINTQMLNSQWEFHLIVPSQINLRQSREILDAITLH